MPDLPRCEKPTTPGLYLMRRKDSIDLVRVELDCATQDLYVTRTGGKNPSEHRGRPIAEFPAFIAWWGPIELASESGV